MRLAEIAILMQLVPLGLTAELGVFVQAILVVPEVL